MTGLTPGQPHENGFVMPFDGLATPLEQPELIGPMFAEAAPFPDGALLPLPEAAPQIPPYMLEAADRAIQGLMHTTPRKVKVGTLLDIAFDGGMVPGEVRHGFYTALKQDPRIKYLGHGAYRLAGESAEEHAPKKSPSRSGHAHGRTKNRGMSEEQLSIVIRSIEKSPELKQARVKERRMANPRRQLQKASHAGSKSRAGLKGRAHGKKRTLEDAIAEMNQQLD